MHIYNEDPAHFAAFSGDLVPDNGADEQVVEFCIVDDFHFFPYLIEVQYAHQFYSEVLAVLLPEATLLQMCGRASRLLPCGRLLRCNSTFASFLICPEPSGLHF